MSGESAEGFCVSVGFVGAQQGLFEFFEDVSATQVELSAGEITELEDLLCV